MALHAEQLHIDKLPEFASTSLSADFIRNYFLLNVEDGEDVFDEFSRCRFYML